IVTSPGGSGTVATVVRRGDHFRSGDSLWCSHNPDRRSRSSAQVSLMCKQLIIRNFGPKLELLIISVSTTIDVARISVGSYSAIRCPESCPEVQERPGNRNLS